MTAARVLEGVRLSELARCPRMCALRGLGVEPAEPTDRARRWMTRGQLFGFYAYKQFEERYGAGEVQREREIVWPHGIGHADVYIRPEKLLIEVVSSTSPDSIIDSKIRQVRQYLHYDPEAERAAVYVINPADLDREELIPVELRPEDVEQIEADVAAVTAAIAGGDLPNCTATTPAGCRYGNFCGFTDVAWDGWFPPPAEELADDPDVVALLVEWEACKQAEAALEGESAAKLERRREIQAELAERGLESGVEYACGGFSIKRSTRAGRETFSMSKAKSAGIWTAAHDEVFAPFVKVGEPWDAWTVKRVGEVSADFGDKAPF